MRRLQILLILLSGSVYPQESMCQETVLLREDFEGVQPGSDISGQLGWVQVNPLADDPMLVTQGIGLPSQVANGHTAAGSDQSQVTKALAGSFEGSEIAILSADAFAFSSEPDTHNAELRLESSTGLYFARWQAALGPRWRFIVSGQPIEDFNGGFDQPVRLEIIIDIPGNTVSGRIQHSTGTFETASYPVTAAQIASLDRVEMHADYRESTNYLGAEFDNLLVLALGDHIFSSSFEVGDLTEWSAR